MDSNIKLFMERSRNEMDLANVVYLVTGNKRMQIEEFHLDMSKIYH